MSNEINSYYDRLAPNYDDDRFGNSYGQFVHRQETRFLDSILGVPNMGERRLDVGCGTGRLLKYATHGVDQSAAMLDVARSKFPDRDFRRSKADDLPFPDGYFDATVCFHLLMHLDWDGVRSVWEEAARTLRPGGVFIFDLPSAERRQLTGYRASGWHGGYQMTVADVRSATQPMWQLEAYQGVLFVPLHRVPKRFRSRLVGVDRYLCKSPWRHYASYVIYVLRKK